MLARHGGWGASILGIVLLLLLTRAAAPEPGQDQVHAELFGVATTREGNRLVGPVDATTGQVLALRDLQDTDSVYTLASALNSRGRTLYLSRYNLSERTGQLLAVNVQSGTLRASGALPYAYGNLAFDEKLGLLYGVTVPDPAAQSPATLGLVNTVTGALLPITVLGGSTYAIANGTCALDAKNRRLFLTRSKYDTVLRRRTNHLISVSLTSGAVAEGQATDYSYSHLGFHPGGNLYGVTASPNNSDRFFGKIILPGGTLSFISQIGGPGLSPVVGSGVLEEMTGRFYLSRTRTRLMPFEQTLHLIGIRLHDGQVQESPALDYFYTHLQAGACPEPVSPPYELPFPTIISDFGPRVPGQGSSFHRGVDFRAAAGTAIPAVESGTITEIGAHSGYGWVVTITGASTGAKWNYCHTFRDASLPINSGRFRLGRTAAGQLYLARFAPDGQTVEAVFVAQGATNSATEVVVNGRAVPVRMCVASRELFAASGNSATGTAGSLLQAVDAAELLAEPVDRTAGRAALAPHLHLMLGGSGTAYVPDLLDNPLVYLQHATSAYACTFAAPAATVPHNGTLTADFTLNTAAGLDLDQVRLYLDTATPAKEVTPVATRAAFNYGGLANQKPSPSCTNVAGETVGGQTYQVIAQDAVPATGDIEPGKDRFRVTGVPASPLTVGPHVLLVRALSIRGQVFEFRRGFSVVP